MLRVEEKDGGVHRVHGRPFVRERADGRTYRVGMGGFWQVHPQAADTLIKAVMQGLMPRKGEMALDLYCGVGIFAGALAERLGETGAVLGIESTKRAVEDARHNLADFPRVRIEQGKVETVLPKTGITECDLVVLDPPRAARASRRSATWPASRRAASPTSRATRRPGPGPGLLPRLRLPPPHPPRLRPLPDDPPRGVCRHPGAGEEGCLTCSFAGARYAPCERYGRYLDAQMTLAEVSRRSFDARLDGSSVELRGWSDVPSIFAAGHKN